MPKRYKRYFLKTKEAKEVLHGLSEKLNIDPQQAFNFEKIELLETEFGEIFLIGGRLLLFKIGENVFPTLVFKEVFPFLPIVIVDMGAIPHVCNGADIMAPGVVNFEGEIRKGKLVLVADERNRKPIAIGEALYDANVVKTIKKGVIIKNHHFVGDKIWNFIKEIERHIRQ